MPAAVMVTVDPSADAPDPVTAQPESDSSIVVASSAS